MYDLGIRHASLTWNEENHLATGVAGPAERGLTDLGKEFLDFIEQDPYIINEDGFLNSISKHRKYLLVDYLFLSSHNSVKIP